MQLEPVLDAVKYHFFGSALLERVAVLKQMGRQRELWFDVELAYLFAELKKTGTIKSWSPQCPTESKTCDFKIELPDGTFVIIEIKAIQQLDPRKKSWKLRGSARDLTKEIPKMMSIPAASHYLLVFGYPVRSDIEWKDMVSKMAHLLPDHIISLARAADNSHNSPGEGLSIGWLHVTSRAGGPGC